MKKLFSRVQSFTHSIRFRLVAWFALILILLLAAFNIFLFFNLVRDVRGESMFRMDRKMDDVIRLAQWNEGRMTLPDGILHSTDSLIVIDADGNLIASFGDVPADQVIAIISQPIRFESRIPGDLPPFTTNESIDGLDYSFALAQTLNPQGESLTFILGSPFDPYGLVNRIILTLIAGSLLTLIIALGGGLWIADRAIRPVKSITHTAREISETDLSRRINLNAKDEIGQLAETFDDMLARLESAFEKQRQFVADASHELRTPLTVVNIEASRALSSKRSEQDYQQALSVIHSENEFMTRLVNDLLTLARMDNVRAPIEKEALDLSSVALDAVERLEPLAQKRGVRLETGDLPEINMTGNPRLLIQLVSNLIENGIKYAGGIDPFVRVETGSDGASFWLKVIDNGKGIPADHLPKLFDRFYRVDEARARGDDDLPGGSGLGLAIAQSIAQAHGAEIKVVSELGKGAVFTVMFGG
jgi:signal transduction histidine kinase